MQFLKVTVWEGAINADEPYEELINLDYVVNILPRTLDDGSEGSLIRAVFGKKHYCLETPATLEQLEKQIIEK